ncbi:GTP 3',8-cyclase MoaA [Rubinisphaera sp.]|uniref:GTP 3',8-cyclase MoaA n=1 Tax=Rubinisphaera sp. TaxID=2024857 RepID=UPI000C10139F|nr:GTP 3',8-cyclase MoaA [Rubinisphaera sp.]MBV09818.1 GTP 3',8-cyclase MoaA [Rubinisphaera sp.]
MKLPILQDTFGRAHTNLRVSVTDRCNLRCFYCMPAENVQFLPRPELLTFEEISRFVELMVRRCGVNKVRLTGGEPLVRQSIHELIEQLVDIPGLNDLALTTNGILLPAQAENLYKAGLRRLNISLDTLDRERFKEMTRRDSLDKVLAGIQVAQERGFGPLKLNAVAMRGITEADLVPLAELSRETGIEVRFIEYMPLDAERLWEREKVLYMDKMIEILSREIAPLLPVDVDQSSKPAVSYEFADGRGRIGFISSVTHPFCSRCNRFRLTADGKIRNCLFSLEETDIRDLLRAGATEDEVIAAVFASIQAKKEGHEINTARFLQPERPMYSIGG